MTDLTLTFDADRHVYAIGGNPVPSVTQIIRAVIPRQWNADPWCMQRGTMVHKAAALLLRGQTAAAVVAPVIDVAAPAATAADTSTRKTYRAVLVDKAALIRAAVPGSVAESLLAFDQSAADAFARATKGAANVPGIRFEAVDGLSVRGYSHRGWRVRFEAVSGLSTDRLPVVVVGIMAAIVYISL